MAALLSLVVTVAAFWLAARPPASFRAVSGGAIAWRTVRKTTPHLRPLRDQPIARAEITRMLARLVFVALTLAATSATPVAAAPEGHVTWIPGHACSYPYEDIRLTPGKSPGPAAPRTAPAVDGT